MREILFHRDFKNFTGGHLKVWDYYNHLKSSSLYHPRIFLTESSKRDHSNPWVQHRESIEERYEPEKADILFVGGTDWRDVPRQLSPKILIINLIQHVRHSEPNTELYSYLSRPAVRICVSRAVEESIQKTGQVRGPTYTIPNGMDLQQLREIRRSTKKTIDVLVVGIKAPSLGRSILAALSAHADNIRLLERGIERRSYLQLVAAAKTAIFLPNTSEGFYLPALEAMALNTLVICPDVIGNRSFCIDRQTALMPDFTLEQLVKSAEEARLMEATQVARMIDAARSKADNHSLDSERKMFLKVLAENSN